MAKELGFNRILRHDIKVKMSGKFLCVFNMER